MKYREAHPCRVTTRVHAEDTMTEKAGKKDQQPWAVYTHYKTLGEGAHLQVDHQDGGLLLHHQGLQ